MSIFYNVFIKPSVTMKKLNIHSKSEKLIHLFENYVDFQTSKSNIERTLTCNATPYLGYWVDNPHAILMLNKRDVYFDQAVGDHRMNGFDVEEMMYLNGWITNPLKIKKGDIFYFKKNRGKMRKCFCDEILNTHHGWCYARYIEATILSMY